MNKKIIVALDGLTKNEALTLAHETLGLVWGYKMHELLLREGLGIINDFKPFGNVFADLKFHDIPKTVGYEVAVLAEHGADLISVHASGGKEMLAEAVSNGREKIVGITILTSLSEKNTEHLYGASVEKTVQKLTAVAREAQVTSLVCSPHEIQLVKKEYPGVRIITPGIRLEESNDDQKRTMSAREAVEAGADLLVIGRPITKAPDPRQALETILSTLKTIS